jgi:hypothetical protein
MGTRTSRAPYLMTRRIYLNFHPEHDLWRVNQLRTELVGPATDQTGFFDPAEYAELLLRDKATIRQRIRERVAETSVTLLLLGSETASRPFVQIGIEESIANLNGFVGVQIHGIDDQSGEPSPSGPLPLLPAEIPFPCYVWDWDLDRLQQEIEAAGRRADRWRAAVAEVRQTRGIPQP